MSRDDLIRATRRTLVHAQQGTVPIEEGLYRVPTTNYYDPERWRAEIDKVFRRVPLVLGFSVELREPNSYKALDVLGTPVLVIRGEDGVLRSFVNMCSHRGAIVMPEGKGHARRFTCPYHAWSYDGRGDLVGVLDRNLFGDLDTSCLGLTPLPVAERAGIVFGGITPGMDFDIDAYLGGYGEMLSHLGFEHCWFAGSQQVAGPNWKLAYDGYLDFYHLPILHKDTFGPDYSNKTVCDAWGPHQRLVQPDQRILALEQLAEDDWPMDKITGGVWTIFPHISIAGFDAGGRLFMVSQLFPGPTPETSVTTQNFLATFDPDATPETREAITKRMDFLMHVVRDEDYATGLGIQRTVKTGAKREFVFGRNEGPAQRFHQWLETILATGDDELVALFANAPAISAP